MDSCTGNSATLRTTTVLCKPFYQRKFAPFRYRATAHTHRPQGGSVRHGHFPQQFASNKFRARYRSLRVCCVHMHSAHCAVHATQASPTALLVVVGRIASRTSADTDPTLTLTDLTPRPTTMALCLRRWCELDPPPLLPADTGLEGSKNLPTRGLCPSC